MIRNDSDNCIIWVKPIKAGHWGTLIWLAGSSTGLRISLSDSLVGLSLFWAADLI